LLQQKIVSDVKICTEILQLLKFYLLFICFNELNKGLAFLIKTVCVLHSFSKMKSILCLTGKWSNNHCHCRMECFTWMSTNAVLFFVLSLSCFASFELCTLNYFYHLQW